MSLTALALTAGLGTRLQPYTLERAKPALPFLGVPLALHSLRHLENLPLSRLILNLHHLPDSIRSIPLQSMHLPAPEYSDETTLILDSGGAVANVIRDISTPHLLVANGDEVYLPHSSYVLEDAYEDHRDSGRLATLVTMDHPEVGRSLGGAWTDDRNRVVRFSKTAVTSLRGHHYVGYLFLRKRVEKYFKIPLQPENILYDCLTNAIAAGEEVSCFSAPAYWYETGRIELFLQSTRELLHLMQIKKSEPAIQEFIEFLKRFSTGECVIEKEDPTLTQKIRDLLTS